jgi:ATP-dependent protease ClpP protease subunit
VNDTAEAMDNMNIDFTPNAARSIVIEGQLNETLLERLRPEILELTSRSREPITVFLNSSGGNPEVQREILNLLRPPRKDGSRASVITVAAKAESAAAHLLSAGDFAIASSDSRLLYHGGRWPLSDLVDAGEAGLLYARTLPTFREMAAATLAANCARRFMFIVSAHRPLFASQSEKADSAADLKAFSLILRGKLSEAGQKVLDRTTELDEAFNGVLLEFQKRLRRGRGVTIAKLRRAMLHAAIAFVYQAEAELGWDGGLGRIADHFYCLNSYFDVERFREWIAMRPSTQSPDVEADYLLRFRQLFLSVCRALQEGENNIAPSDALWLGLVDTVGGAQMSERPTCPWCGRDFGSWPAAKVHVKNCALAPRPRWAEHQKRRKAHGS